MIVSNNTLLNILLPNENKTLKEVLKEADTKSLSSNKSTNIQDVLKNLVDNLKSETKSSEAISNLLKNSSVFKDLGNFPKDLESLVKNLPNDEKLSNLKTTLQSFLVNIKDLDENKLKDLVQKSGIFLESKIANSGQNPNVAKLNEILTQIKELIKNDTSPKAKELTVLIDKILTQNSSTKASPTLNTDIKQAITLLKDIVNASQNPNSNKIVNLTNQLETMNLSTKLAQSKIQNNILPQEQKSSITSETKLLLSNLKVELLSSKNPIFSPIIKQINTLLQSNDIFSKNQNTLEPKALMQNLLQSPNLNLAAQEVPKINQLISQLSNQIQNIEKLESNILKGQVNPSKIQEVQNSIKQTLTQLQSALSEVKNVDVKGLNQIIDKLLNIKNLFSKIEVPQNLQQSNNPSANVQNSKAEIQTQQNIQQNAQQNVEKTVQQNNSKPNTLQQSINNTAKETVKSSSASPVNQTQNEQKISIADNKTISLSKNDTTQSTIQINLNEKTVTAKTEQPSLQNLNQQLQNNQNSQEIKPLLTGLQDNIKSIITAIKSSLAQVQLKNPATSSENFNQFEVSKSINKLETFFQTKFENIQNQLLQNSKSPNDFLQNDIKSALLQLQEESSNNPKLQDLSKNVEKLLTHIDYYQLLSVTSSSNYLYLPFIWDMLEDGSISMKQLNDEKYFCEIHLTLKEFGNMDLLLGLYDDNSLDISIFSNKEFVKDMIKENLVALKVGLNKVGIVAQNIKILDLKDEKEIKETPVSVYHNSYPSDDLGFGVDIKV